MLSRRSVRIKVMQLLYAMNRDKSLSFAKTKDNYWRGIENTFELFLFCLFAIIQITRVAVEERDKRKSKYLPGQQDKEFTAILFENSLIQDLLKNQDLSRYFSKYGFAERIDKDLCRNIYSEFTKQKEDYLEWACSPQDDESVLETLLALFRFCRRNETFIELVENQFAHWEDVNSEVVGAIKKALKSLPSPNRTFFMEFYPTDDTIKNFGEELLTKVHEEDPELLALIKPALKNWDFERVAVIDMLIIKMALCELLFFESIPTKVTLNEYVDLAKTYSTEKSKEFTNGVLDRLMKDLQNAGRIKKTGSGLLE